MTNELDCFVSVPESALARITQGRTSLCFVSTNEDHTFLREYAAKYFINISENFRSYCI
jgi:hypothetical protein